MRLDDKTICDAVNVSWIVAQQADSVEDEIRRWERVSYELLGFFNLVNWGLNNSEERETFNEIAEDILFLKRLAEFNAYGMTL